ncbi:HEPN domain-containing protein [Chromobacterium haemolyticum]|uniref:HEPN domain-containing protein n=1 Tax=Chromobacterium haemolyticum TaxID=394935 RepID=UPI00138E3654|nr:HEPN domain-containing protein [Chromobacterium haemolyticum]
MNSEHAYRLSQSFLVAANRANEYRVIDDKFQVAIVPAIVCAAFSVEVGLKALIFKETGHECKREHKIASLFEKLPNVRQEEIRSLLVEKYNDINEKMKGISNAFVEWRYVYEKDYTEIDSTFLFDFAKVIADISNCIWNFSSGNAPRP